MKFMIVSIGCSLSITAGETVSIRSITWESFTYQTRTSNRKSFVSAVQPPPAHSSITLVIFTLLTYDDTITVFLIGNDSYDGDVVEKP